MGGNEISICFVAFEKAFDRVDCLETLEILRKICVEWRDRITII